MKKTLIILAAFALLLSGCKSSQKTAYTHTKKMRINKLLREVEKQRFSARTLETRIGISYSDANQSFSGNGKIRILKDSIIWGSINFIGIPMAKFYITPKKIQYYNKIDQTYYDGNFDLLVQELGLSLSFNNLQNLLTGDLITNINPEKAELSVNSKNYEIKPGEKYIKNLVVTPFFKMLEATFYDPSRGEILLKYNNYQKTAEQNLPGNFEIKTQDKYIKIDYKSISIDKNLRYPFRLPENYKLIKL